MTRDKVHPELRGLLTDLAGDGLDAQGRLRLEQILNEDKTSREFYCRYMQVEASLRWQSQSVLRASSIAPAVSVETANAVGNGSNNGSPDVIPIAALDAVDSVDPIIPESGRSSGGTSSPVLGFLGGAVCKTGEFLNRPTPFWVLISATVLVPLFSLFVVVAVSTEQYEKLVDERIAAERSSLVQPPSMQITPQDPNIGQLAANIEAANGIPPGSVAQTSTKEPEPISIAYLERQSADARWATQQTAALMGVGLQLGRELRLISGLAEISFESGAKVILQAPVNMVLSGPNAAELDAGKLTAYVPPQAKGFSVKSQHVTVIDLGTEFGMNAMGQHEAEVHVFTGVVEAELAPRDENVARGRVEPTTLRLEKDVALRVDPLAVTVLKQPADPDNFIRRMPGAGVTDRPFIRNPSFEYPPIKSHQQFNTQFGNAMSLPIAGWVECSGSAAAKLNAGYQISPYGFTVNRNQFIGPGASHGKQVALLVLSGETAAEKPVKSAWIFQCLGTVSQKDLGRTVEASADVVAGRISDADQMGKKYGEGAKADVTFATDVSETNAGTAAGSVGVKQKLIRKDGVCELKAALTIDEQLLGKRLYLR